MRRRRKRRFTGLSRRKMQGRMIYLFLGAFVIALVLVVAMIHLQTTKGQEYERKALSQQSYVSKTVQYRRGDIVDRNGNKLATSHKVYNVILEPQTLFNETKSIEPTKKALKQVFGIAGSEIDSIIRNHSGSCYYVMKKYKGVSDTYVKKFHKLQEKNDNIKGVWFEEAYKRVYPYSTIASDVIGFCASENNGSWGIENTYNNQLNGTYGRRYGFYDTDLNLVETVKAATNGNTVKSTIDVNVQGILEKHIADFRKNIGAKNIGCILMNPNNGEIYAMASNEAYDLNNPRDLTQFYDKDEIAKMSDKTKLKILNEIWRNFCISNAYEPGSTFKPMTVAACLDEGVTKDGNTYVCDGGQKFGNIYIKCVAHAIGGHGRITICKALMVSCNDVLMQLGAKLGKKKFLKYDNEYGFGKATGIDLPGEAIGQIFNDSTMHDVELATSSFGQGQTMTMIQMASAFSCVVNGGNYYQPHVVKDVLNESGVSVMDKKDYLVRKVITPQTSKLIRGYLYQTVEGGSAAPAAVEGYEIGGKTGTAEKHPTGRGNYLVSFIGCVPVNKPQVVIYTVIDEPNVADEAHSTYATEFSSGVMKDVLPLLGVYPKGGKKKIKKVKLPSSLSYEMPKNGLSEGDYSVANGNDGEQTSSQAENGN